MKFWWGESKDAAERRLNGYGSADGFQFVSPVDHYGSRGRNKFGLADMLGNVAEWCLDEFDRAGAHEEPYKGYPSLRVARGGSFGNSWGFVRCPSREGPRPNLSSSMIGFRAALGMEPSAKTP
jgi:formylglycine-generating enzyme required for sulfatase activity